MTAGTQAAAVTAMTKEQREQFDRDGYLVVPGVLDESEVAFYAEALDRVYATEREAGRLSAQGAMHKLSAAAGCPDAVGLIDHPHTFPPVRSILRLNPP